MIVRCGEKRGGIQDWAIDRRTARAMAGVSSRNGKGPIKAPVSSSLYWKLIRDCGSAWLAWDVAEVVVGGNEIDGPRARTYLVFPPGSIFETPS